MMEGCFEGHRFGWRQLVRIASCAEEEVVQSGSTRMTGAKKPIGAFSPQTQLTIRRLSEVASVFSDETGWGEAKDAAEGSQAFGASTERRKRAGDGPVLLVGARAGLVLSHDVP